MKKWIGLLLIMLVISNGYWFYTTVDNAVTLHYAQDSARSSANRLEQAIRLANLNVIGKSAEEVLQELTPDVYGLEPFEKEGCIYAGQICLMLSKNRTVIEVH